MTNPITPEPMIEIEQVTKVYQMGDIEVQALRGIRLLILDGEYVAVIGASGSGKSTLMNIIGLLDQPSSSTYEIRGTEVSQLSKSRLSDLRNSEIGFIFQRFNLLARTSAQRQVELPLFYAGITGRQAKEMALAALARVGLQDRAHHRPDELSGGQQQRVAIARALVNQPHLLLADEPTGALDSKTGQEVLALFDELHQQGLTLIVVTHDHDVAKRAERIITISDGQIVEDRRTDPQLRGSVVSPDAVSPDAVSPDAVVQESDGVRHELSNGAGGLAAPATIEVTASPEPQLSMSGE